jgi:hypothetical protein
VSVRYSLVREKVHPLLCLDITRRFIGDTEKFLDDELCSSSTSISINDSWVLIGLRDCDLLAISRSALNKTIVLMKERMDLRPVDGDKGMNTSGLWQREVIRCARIVSVCSSVSCSNKNQMMTDFCNDKEDLIIDLAVLLMEGAEKMFNKFDIGNVTKNSVVSDSKMNDKDESGSANYCISIENQSNLEECDLEFMIRMSIVLFIVSLTALATAVTRMKVRI